MPVDATPQQNFDRFYSIKMKLAFAEQKFTTVTHAVQTSAQNASPRRNACLT